MSITRLHGSSCRYRKRQRESREERARAFEAVFEDPELELEEIATQARTVCRCYICLVPLRTCLTGAT